MTAGFIAAEFDNGTGIDGMNRFAKLAVMSHGSLSGVSERERRMSFGALIVSDLPRLVASRPDGDMPVVNVSLGYNWVASGFDLRQSWAAGLARRIADEQGALAEVAMRKLATEGPLPVVVVSAGNDSEYQATDARDGSPLTNAALVRGVKNIIVVEALGRGRTFPARP